MRPQTPIAALSLVFGALVMLCGCAGSKPGGSTMGDFSGGSVSFGKLVTNIARVDEAEPTELSKTIHNQVLAVVGKYTVGGVVMNADYDLVFGPYPPDSPNLGEIKLVESPGTDHVPEVEIVSGYAAVGGAWPIARAPGTRGRTNGTQYALVVKPGSSAGDFTVYVLYIHQTGSESVIVDSTATGGPSQSIPSKDKFCKVTVVSNVVTAIDPPADIASADAFVKDFHVWVGKMIGSAALRN